MILVNISGNDIRNDIQSKWHEHLNKYGNLFSSDHISGSSPPSVFVGSYGYPKVGVGPVSYTHMTLPTKRIV